jgi:hypothetical protein
VGKKGSRSESSSRDLRVRQVAELTRQQRQQTPPREQRGGASRPHHNARPSPQHVPMGHQQHHVHSPSRRRTVLRSSTTFVLEWNVAHVTLASTALPSERYVLRRAATSSSCRSRCTSCIWMRRTMQLSISVGRVVIVMCDAACCAMMSAGAGHCSRNYCAHRQHMMPARYHANEGGQALVLKLGDDHLDQRPCKSPHPPCITTVRHPWQPCCLAQGAETCAHVQEKNWHVSYKQTHLATNMTSLELD